jgi:hypothetical protein
MQVISKQYQNPPGREGFGIHGTYPDYCVAAGVVVTGAGAAPEDELEYHHHPRPKTTITTTIQTIVDVFIYIIIS